MGFNRDINVFAWPQKSKKQNSECLSSQWNSVYTWKRGARTVRDERLNKLKEDEKRKEIGKARAVVNIPNDEHEKYQILDPELSARSGDTVLHLQGIILELVAEHCPNLLTRRSIKGQTVFHVAAVTQKMEDKYGNTALHYAVMMRDLDGVAMLFSADEKVSASFHNVMNHWGNNPLHAVMLGTNNSADVGGDRLRVCKAIGGKCAPQSKSLAKEIKESNAALVQLIRRERGKLINSTDQKGNRPLHWAASMGDVKCAEMLLQQDELSTLEWDQKGYLSVYVACKRGHVEVVKKIVEQSWVDPKDLLNKRGQNMLHIAAKNGKEQVVNYMLRQKKQLAGDKLLNEQDQNGNTASHLASKYLYPSVLLLLT
ncbi:hypothetical protein K1719_025007 [Acacia pycnantha]|nr:hypothetical protein K1719_025007 [Acacia pycnantha]